MHRRDEITTTVRVGMADLNTLFGVDQGMRFLSAEKTPSGVLEVKFVRNTQRWKTPHARAVTWNTKPYETPA